jgi:hypothetical protein
VVASSAVGARAVWGMEAGVGAGRVGQVRCGATSRSGGGWAGVGVGNSIGSRGGSGIERKTKSKSK